MQQFVVPQFIDVEDKIFGPITVRQFLILLVGGTLVFLFYRFADFGLFVFLTVLVGGVTLILAFVKVNGQTFHYFLLNLIQTIRRPSERVWGKGYTDRELKELLAPEKTEESVSTEGKQSKREHIRQLSLIVNTGGYYKGDEE